MNGTIRCTLLVLAMMCSMLAGCGNSTSSDYSTVGIFPGGGPSAWKVQKSTTFRNNTTAVTDYIYDPTSKFLTGSDATTTSGADTETTKTTYSGFDSYGNPTLVLAITTPSGKTVKTTNSYFSGALYTSITTTTIGGITTSIFQSYTYNYFGKTITTNFYNGDITVNPSLPLVKTDASSYDSALNLYSQVITDYSVAPSITTTTTWTITEYQNIGNALNRPKIIKKYQNVSQGGTVLMLTTLISTTTKTYILDSADPANGQLKSFIEQFEPGNPINRIEGISSYNTDGNLTSASIKTTYSSSATTEETLAETWVIP